MPTTITPTVGTAACPAPEELGALLASDVSGERLAELTEHVGGCPGCQKRMDRLATHEMPILAEAIRSFDKQEIPRNSALWNVLDSNAGTVTRNVPTARPDPDLAFLQPSDVPGRLGRIGEFDVVRLVGRGGMGVVLHAYDPALQRDVAVKVLDPQLASNDTARQRFLREARAAAAVAHENIVAVHSVNEGSPTDLPYFVMQLVVGESLEQRLRRVGQLGVGETASIGAQAAAGLAAAHATGLIHRDVKPGNILIEAATERVKLTDFGLARAHEDIKLTRTGFVSGTPLYMAPEQAKGDEVDSRADLFSLGVVLYECLAGKPPFDGKTPLAVLRQVADSKHEPLSTGLPDLPAWLEDVIDRLLAKAPKDRIDSAAELHALLAPFAPASAGPCDPASASEPCPMAQPSGLSRRDLRRWKVRFALLMTVPFLLGLLVGAGTLLAVAGVPARSPVVVQADGPKPPPLAEVPGEPPLSVPVAKFPAETGGVWSMALTPDGATMIMGLEDGRILVYDIATRKVAKTLPAHRGAVFGLDIFPDGKRFASGGDDGRIYVWNLATLGERPEPMTAPNGVRAVAVGRDGLTLATGDRGGNVTVWDVDTHVPVPGLEFDQGGSVQGLAYSTDKTKPPMLLSSGSNKVTNVWALTGKDKEPTGTLAGHPGPVYAVAYSEGNELIASAGWDGEIRVWNADTFQPYRTLKGHKSGVWSVAFSKCRKMLASAGQDGTVRIWDVEAGQEIRRYNAHQTAAHVVRFAGDCKTVYSGGRDGDVRSWDTGKP